MGIKEVKPAVDNADEFEVELTDDAPAAKTPAAAPAAASPPPADDAGAADNALAAFDAPLDVEEPPPAKEKPAAPDVTATPRDEADEPDPDGLTPEELAKFTEEQQSKYKNLSRTKRSIERKYKRAEKQLEEALSIIKHQREFIQQAQSIITNGEQQYVGSAKAAAQATLQQAENAVKAAYEAGDPTALVAAQKLLTQAQVAMMQAEGYQPIAPQIEARAKQFESIPTEMPQGAQPDPRTVQWVQKNPWFTTNQFLQNYAVQYADQLEKQGISVVSDPDTYFSAIDAEMHRRFPEAFALQPQTTPPVAAQQVRRTTSPVAPATPTAPAPNRVKLPGTAKQIAEKLGIPLETYAREYASRNRPQ